MLVIVDIQEGLINMVRDWDTALYKANMLAHGGLAQVFDLPVIITSSASVGPNGMVPKELTAMHPNATVIDRNGEVNAWDSKEFRDAVRATGKTQVIVAGIMTDICKKRSPLTLSFPSFFFSFPSFPLASNVQRPQESHADQRG